MSKKIRSEDKGCVYEKGMEKRIEGVNLLLLGRLSGSGMATKGRREVS